MGDVLSVAAFEFCNPVAFRIGVEVHDSPSHSSSGVIDCSPPTHWPTAALAGCLAEHDFS